MGADTHLRGLSKKNLCGIRNRKQVSERTYRGNENERVRYMDDEQMVICILQRLYARGELAKAPLQIATIAIEKQRPKKPIAKESRCFPDEYSYLCPSCGEKRMFKKRKFDFCPDCGQMFDWELL